MSNVAGLPFRFSAWIVGREGDVELLLVADLDADQLVLEARDQLARAEHDRHVLAGAAVERDAVDLADEVDHHLVAVGGLVALLGVLVAGLRRGELLQLLVDRLLVDLDGQALELQAVDLRRRERRAAFRGGRWTSASLPVS